MSVTIPIEHMTLEEKLQTMETIWDDLCRKNADIASPSWHHDVLNEREKALQNGNEKFVDWKTAKNEFKPTQGAITERHCAEWVDTG